MAVLEFGSTCKDNRVVHAIEKKEDPMKHLESRDPLLEINLNDNDEISSER